MPTEVSGDIENLQGRAGGDFGLTDGEEDISGGVEADVDDVESFTLYLGVSTSTAIDVQVYLSPDGGQNWYEPDESPVSFTSSDESAVEHIPYNTSRLRIVGSNTTPVKGQVRQVV